MKKKSPILIEDAALIEEGRLDVSIYNTLAENKKKNESEKKSDIPVIIATKIIEDVRLVDENDEEGVIIPDEGERNTALLYIPALLTHYGNLQPAKENVLPWMPIEALKPFGEYVSVGTWKPSSSDMERNYKSWGDYWNSAKRKYEEETGSKWDNTSLDDIERKGRRYDLQPYSYIIYDDTVDSTFHIRKLYYGLLEFCSREKFAVPLLEKMLTKPLEVSHKEYHPYDENNIECMKKHLGVMSGQWTLSPSQRESLHHLKELCEGEVLAVAGPPGTGKTTLLQSVVADMMVEHAINEKRAPIIVATSTNNKAVVNVIDSFSNVSKDNTDKLGVRWTRAHSLAAFLPSSSQKGKKKFENYFITSKMGEGKYKAFEDERDKMVEEFKINYANYFGSLKIGDSSYWKKVTNCLLSEMKERREVMLKILNAIGTVDSLNQEKKTGSWLRKVWGWIGLQQLRDKMIDSQIEKAYCELEKRMNLLNKYGFDYKERLRHITKHLHKSEELSETDNVRMVRLSELNGILDITLRYQMFWLAVHYYEARWLSGEDVIEDNKYAFMTTKTIQDKRMHRMAMLTPCMVMTFFMMPDVFSLYEKDNKKFPYYQDIDLLIVDEAGQASPEVALPSFALAKRAIIVGDVYQIPPVWSVSEKVDYEMAKMYNLSSDEHKFGNMPLNCSSSSLMKVACSVCQFQKYPIDKDGKGERGLFLTEHRRCYREIIEFCNDLIYQGRLRPLRPAEFDEQKKDKLGMECPAMGHVHVEHPESESKDGSRNCIEEAKEIAKWLANNFEVIKTAYGKQNKETKEIEFKVNETISVITPFKVQASIIDEELQKVCKTIPGFGPVPIPCGTVHTFQGAESAIVIFSTVYGKDEGWKFIKDNDNLINVAVSRAKDYFFTFGERSISGGGNSDNAAQMLIDYTESQVPDKCHRDR